MIEIDQYKNKSDLSKIPLIPKWFPMGYHKSEGKECFFLHFRCLSLYLPKAEDHLFPQS